MESSPEPQPFLKAPALETLSPLRSLLSPTLPRCFQGPVMVEFSSVQMLSCVQLFVTPWTAAHQASLSITNSQSLLKLMSIESVMPSNHLILCQPLLLLPSIFASIRVFSKESVLHIRKPKYWSFSFSVSPSNEYSGLTSLISLQSKGLFIYLLFFSFIFISWRLITLQYFSGFCHTLDS